LLKLEVFEKMTILLYSLSCANINWYFIL